MSNDNKAEATMKNIEGKAQEALGEITGDPQDKAEGKQKQAEAAAQHEIENVKEAAKQRIENR